MTELLLEKGYEVHGIVRRSSSLERPRLQQFYGNPDVYEKRLFLHYADLTDTTTIRRIVAGFSRRSFIILAGQSHVGLSFEIPESTCELTGMATLRIMEILRDLPTPPRFLHASSREISEHRHSRHRTNRRRSIRIRPTVSPRRFRRR